MKQSRLLEIIREEISSALNEAGLGDQITALDKQIEAATKQISPLQKKLADLQGKKADLQKKEADLSTKTQTQLEEDSLNEEPDFGGQFDKQVAAKYGEEDTLEVATEKITNRVLSDKGITKADVAKMDKKELDSLLKDIRAFISQKKQTPEVAAALKKQTEFDDSGSKLQDNQTNKAILRALGFGSKKGPKGPTKAKAEPKAKTEKTPKAKAEKAEPADSEDKEATQNIDNDEIAKNLSNVTGVADKFANLFNASTTEEAKKKMQALAKKANEGDPKAKAFFTNKKYSKIIKDYMSKKQVNV
jgi:hypothetical protein